MVWMDAREVARLEYLSWGWPALDAAWSAYYGRPFSAVLVRAA
jgi:hypothetical protein